MVAITHSILQQIRGTGSEYKELILFNIACLKVSELPFIIYDSLLFTDIEMDRVEKIIKFFSKLKT